MLQAPLHNILSPRKGHLQAILRLFGYLKRYPNAAIPVDSSFLPSSTTDEFEFQQANDWTEVFPDAHEAVPYMHQNPSS